MSALADDPEWSYAEKCIAGSITYFFLKTTPATKDMGSGKIRVVSAAGNTYDCLIMGDRVAFSWVNSLGEKMSSYSTRWYFHGDTLTVETDMTTKVFRLVAGRLTALN